MTKDGPQISTNVPNNVSFQTDVVPLSQSVFRVLGSFKFPHTEWEEVGSQKINLLEILYFFILSKADRNVTMSPGVSK